MKVSVQCPKDNVSYLQYFKLIIYSLWFSNYLLAWAPGSSIQGFHFMTRGPFTWVCTQLTLQCGRTCGPQFNKDTVRRILCVCVCVYCENREISTWEAWVCTFPMKTNCDSRLSSTDTFVPVRWMLVYKPLWMALWKRCNPNKWTQRHKKT